jgi:hypothetical protein
MELLSCTVFKFLNQHYKRWFRINFYIIIYQNVYIVHFFVQFYTELTLGVYVFCFFFDKNWSCQTLLYWKIGSAEQHELGFLTQRPKLINTTQNEKKNERGKTFKFIHCFDWFQSLNLHVFCTLVLDFEILRFGSYLTPELLFFCNFTPYFIQLSL